MRTFLAGPGESIPLQALVIRFEGVIRVEGNLLRCVCYVYQNHHQLVHTELVYHHESIASSFLQGTRRLSSAYRGLRPTSQSHMKTVNATTIVGYPTNKASRGSLRRMVSVCG